MNIFPGGVEIGSQVRQAFGGPGVGYFFFVEQIAWEGITYGDLFIQWVVLWNGYDAGQRLWQIRVNNITQRIGVKIFGLALWVEI